MSIAVQASPVIFETSCNASCFCYDWGMKSLQEFVESQLGMGRGYFTKPDGRAATRQTPGAFQAAIARLKRKGSIVSPRRGFYLILRPEDRALGAPDPARWIDPMMKFLEVDYRISLLRAAAFHGSAHQAAMVFQVIAPRQLPDIELGRQRVAFLFQSRDSFAKTNRSEWLEQLKTDAGYAKVACVELALLDICRYFHEAAGINGVAQAVHDLGKKADARILAKAAGAYENSAVRRLGYLLERYGHSRQAQRIAALCREGQVLQAARPVSQAHRS